MKGNKYYTKAKLLHKKMYEISSNNTTNTDRKDIYKRYLNLIRKAAYLGNTEAQFDLGQQYESMNFLGVVNPIYNPKKCIYWYTKACKRNNPMACNNLASYFENGVGCKKDLKKAYSLYKKAAELGYSIGIKNFRIMQHQIATRKIKI